MTPAMRQGIRQGIRLMDGFRSYQVVMAQGSP